MTLDSVGLEAAAKVLAFRDLAADPDWHGVYEEEWAAQPEEYREAWRESVREVLAPYLAAVVPVTPTTENHDTVEWLRSTSREFASHGFRSCDVSLLDAERVARAERERGFAAGRAAATPPLHGTGYCPQPCPECAAATPDPPTSDEFTEAAWGLIANAYGGNWSEAPDEWHGAAARWRDEYVAGAVAAPPAASPDERLREALAFYADKGNYTAQNPVGSGAHVWRDMGGRARAALAAADREKPDKPHTQDCQDAMFMHHAATGGDMECTCRPPVSDDPTGITRPTPEPDRRARFGRIAPHVSDDPVNDPETNT